MRDYKSMKKYGCLILFLLMLSSAFAAEVEPDVVQALEQDSEAPVIVILKEGAGKSAAASILENHGDDDDVDVNVERRYSSIPGFSGTITSEGLERLDDDPGVESIFLDKVLHITLDTSVAQVNAPAVWNFSVGGYNITGKGETVCVLDTGIDTDHPAFQDKIKSQYCYCGGNCCPGGTSEEANAEDDNALGHGTHVAGIAAGNLTTYMGIARDAGIYAIKVCDAAGSCATSDILAGIDRCSDPANISAFNLSAISLSLGDSSQNNAYCNDDALAPAINTAVGRNISVVIASGNDGFTAGISAPACVQNATPVGTVNDDDAIQYNRGAILELLAPGDSIISATIGGGTAALSGSSMAAPHLSGSIALLRQYWRLAYGRTPTVDELERKFMITGRVVDDSGNSGKSYSRIDLLTALSPFLNFSEASVANNSFTNTNTSFITAVSDVNLTNALLEWSYSNGSIVNITLDKVNGTGFYLNLTHLREGQDTYRVYGNDTVGTIGISVGRVLTIDTTVPAVTLSSPANGSNLSSGSVEFNATMLEANINAVRFLFSNASGNDFNLSPANHSGNWNANVNLSRLTEGLQSMLAYADDRAGNLNSTQLVEFTVARTPPAVTVISPNSGQNYSLASGNQVFNASVADALLSVPAVRFSFDNASGNGFNLTATLQSGYWSVQYNVSTLSNGSHTVTILSNDTAGNYNTTETISFTVDTGMLQVQLLTPVDGNINSSTALNFNCSVQDYIELSNLTLYGNWSSGWHANETVAVSGNRSSVVFSKTLPEGTYAWNCRAYDTVHHSIFAPANYTLTVDATAPVISAVSSGTPSSESATITWTTSESADARVDYGTSLSLGTISSTASRSTSQSRTLSGLDAATTYFFNVTSCDAANNCLTNGTFNFTAAAASGSGSADAGGGAAGGGGGGGGSSTSTAASESSAGDTGEDSSSGPADEEEGPAAAALTSESTSSPLITFSQSMLFSRNQSNIVNINEDQISVKKVEINSKVDRETEFRISYLPERPVEIPAIPNPYQYFEMTVNLTPDEIERAVATFEVPASWLEENHFLKKTVALNVLEGKRWKKLSTTLIDEKEGALVYQAKLKHFSYFAINAYSELEFSWFKNLIPPRLGSRGFVIFGMMILIAFLTAAYWFLHRGEAREDRV